VRNYGVLLATAGLMAGQVVMGSSASATVALGTGFQTSVAAKSSNSLSLTISGVPKARVKVKGSGYKQVLRSSTVMSLPTGKYRVRAFAVKKNGTSYKPKHRKFTLRAKGGKRFAVKVHYRPVSKTVTIDPSVGTSPSRAAIPASPVPGGEIGTMFALVNQARAQTQKCGSKTMPAVGPVDYSDEIAKAAQAHAQDMADKTYFSHDSLDGRAFDQRIAATKYRGSPGGENIASGFPTAQETLKGWLNSPGHCVNLMDPDFDHMGLGLAFHNDSRYSNAISYWVQDFGYDPSK
jgi:uncharacterized protein YkwD